MKPTSKRSKKKVLDKFKVHVVKDKFKKGDRVESVGGTINCRDAFKKGTIKRKSDDIFGCYVVQWDDGSGWPDRDGKPGWNMKEGEIEPLGTQLPYETDE